MVKVRIEPQGIVGETRKDGERLSDVLDRAGVSLETVCGGRGKCGQCRVIVREGEAAPTEEDRKAISQDDLVKGSRLACALRVLSDMVVEIPTESARNKQVILEEAIARVDLKPAVRTFVLSVPKASLEHQVSDLERVRYALSRHSETRFRFSLRTLKSLPTAIRSSDRLRLVARGDEVLDILPGYENGVYGIAVDIGTTTVVAYLIDLNSGDCVSVSSRMNPQIAHGDDVISRITFALRNPEGAGILQNQITACINELVGECCAGACVDREEVFEVVVVGNTAMHHLFFGLDTSNLGRSPFVPVTSDPVEARSADLGIGIGVGGYVYSLPNVAGFVGADHMGVLLASRLWESERTQMVIDIGTNGEISVGGRSGVASTSCAAGPALEGANIRSGMRATTGAIDHLKISEDFEVTYSTINGGRPRGLCGSAVVDAVSEMFRAGIIGPNGRIRKDMGIKGVQVVNGETHFVLAPPEESGSGQAVSITQKDIGEVQSAKAAMYAGATILMEVMGVCQDDLDAILLAGAFGNYISPKSAMGLGVFPEVPLSKVKQIGNAAGSGAKIALLNEDARDQALQLARRIKFIELAARPEFQDRFFEALYIPHKDTSLFPTVMSRVADINKESQS